MSIKHEQTHLSELLPVCGWKNAVISNIRLGTFWGTFGRAFGRALGALGARRSCRWRWHYAKQKSKRFSGGVFQEKEYRAIFARETKKLKELETWEATATLWYDNDEIYHISRLHSGGEFGVWRIGIMRKSQFAYNPWLLAKRMNRPTRLRLLVVFMPRVICWWGAAHVK